MTATSTNSKDVVGITPWLPWPLCAWSWWTEPVRAERLAMLRIGLGLVLLWDIAALHAPNLFAYFGAQGPGDPATHGWYFDAPRGYWSLLRGVGHEAGMYVALALCVLTTLWILGTSLGRILLRRKAPPDDRTGFAVIVWSVAFTWYVAGVWAHILATALDSHVKWVLPLTGFGLMCLFWSLDLVQRLLDHEHRIGWWSALFSAATTSALLVAGALLAQHEEFDEDAWWARLLKSWQDDEAMLLAALALWLFAAFLLTIGYCTRSAAVAAWLLSLSFYTANSNLYNAGDTIRMFLLFYVMLAPAGAALSLDAAFARRAYPVHVPPLPLRLIFVQMIFVYWMNGLYKVFSEEWLDGSSLYYVLGDVALVRFAPGWLPIPYAVTQVLTWSVLVWELAFPFLVLWKWTRIPTLLFGILFHLGIFATMELGAFVPYALCMYLPLLPWEWLRRRRTLDPQT